MRRTTGKAETRRMIDDMLEMMTEDEMESLRKMMAVMIRNRLSFAEIERRKKMK